MKKLLMLGFVAGALLTGTAACSNPDYEQKDEMTSAPLPDLPPAATGRDSAAVAQEMAKQELNSVNATEAVKKMQPVL